MELRRTILICFGAALVLHAGGWMDYDGGPDSSKDVALDQITKANVNQLTVGDHGLVSLREGLGRDPGKIPRIQSNTPGKIFDNLLLFGSATGESYISPPREFHLMEKLTLQSRGEAFNVLNHPNFALPSGNVSAGAFGQMTTAFDPRILHGSLKLVF